MKRKIVNQGSGAHTISLPIDWIRENNLKQGDYVDINEAIGSLVISTKEITPQKDTEITINVETERQIRIELTSLYRLGHDNIKINFKTKKQKQLIEQICNHALLGFEITTSEKSHLTIENITEPSEYKQDVIFRRMFRILIQSTEILIKEINKGKLQEIKTITEWSNTVGKYDNFCRRNVTLKRFKEENTNLYWGLYNYILLMQRSILHLYENSNNYTGTNKELKPIQKQAKKVFELLEQYYNAYFSLDIKQLEIVSSKSSSLLYEKFIPLITKTKGKASLMAYYLSEFTRTMSISTAPAYSIMLSKSKEEKEEEK